jgi:hypothetical protein
VTVSNYAPDVPVIHADPFALDILADPLAFQEDLRAAGPVVYRDRYDVFVWMQMWARLSGGVVRDVVDGAGDCDVSAKTRRGPGHTEG